MLVPVIPDSRLYIFKSILSYLPVKAVTAATGAEFIEL